MKKLTKIILLALIVSLSLSNMQAQEKAENVYITKTSLIENVKIADLHDRAYNWLMTYFDADGRSIIDRDIDEEFVSANVKVPLKSSTEQLQFNIRIDLKNGEYTYTFADLSIDSKNEEVKKYIDQVALRIKRTMITDFTVKAREQMKK
ncbi:MAG: hypothetical protein U9R19_03920 [Bacteroidota bacterium]|nr:hypothetical protein [Bacteroidota bacterium]